MARCPRHALDQERDLLALADAFLATYVVIDSIVPACGGADPIDPGTAARYAAALEYIGRPVLSLAHVPKNGSLEYPFGSAFFHNLARVTWSLSRDGERLLLANRKANNYGRLGRFSLSITWWNGLPREVHERGYAAALADRIDEVLRDGSMSVRQIVAALATDADEGEHAVKSDSVRTALRRGLTADPPRFAFADEKWSRAEA